MKILWVFLLLLAACAQDTPQASERAAEMQVPNAPPAIVQEEPEIPAAMVSEISIVRYTFAPQTIRMSAGGMVRWINSDSTSHSIRFPGSPSSEILAPGEQLEMQMDDPGIYEYSCGIHAKMKGTILVE